MNTAVLTHSWGADDTCEWCGQDLADVTASCPDAEDPNQRPRLAVVK